MPGNTRDDASDSAQAGAPGAAAPPVLLVIAGAAGSGKSTLSERLVATHPEFSRVITATTRPPRPGEIDGVHYHFLTPAQFDAKLANGEFLEWAWVHQKHRYGTLAASVLGPLAHGRSLAINIDVQGVGSFREAARGNPVLARHMTTVFIDAPMEELRKRMRMRGGESEAEIELRMQTAVREVQEARTFDHVIKSTTRDADFAALLAVWREASARIAESA